MSARGRPQDASEQIIQSTIVGLVTVTFVGIVMWAVGLQVDVANLSWLLIAFVILGTVTKRTTDFNIAFWILTLGLLFTITDLFIPQFFLEPFTPFIELFFELSGVDVRAINGLQWLIVATVITAVALGASYRLTGDRKFIMPIVNAVASDFARYIDVYVTSARIFILLVLTAFIIVFQQTGILLGDLGGIAAQSPYVVSNLFALLLGYLGISGDIPLTPIAFIALGLLAIGVAAAVASEGSGPISQFINRL